VVFVITGRLFNSSTVAIPLAVQATDYSTVLVQAATTGKDPARAIPFRTFLI
jgi:hypothetical protein